jgi:hypothetical protein
LISVYVGVIILRVAALPWSLLCEQLPGFRQVLHFELSCPHCGDFRSAISVDSESMRLPCPRCGETHRPFVLGRGLTRNTVAWVLVSPALSRNRTFRLSGRRTGRPKTAAIAGRILQAANLMLMGKKQSKIARALGLSSSCFALFAKRRQTDIDAELRRLTVNSCVQEAAVGANGDAVMV